MKYLFRFKKENNQKQNPKKKYFVLCSFLLAILLFFLSTEFIFSTSEENLQNPFISLTLKHPVFNKETDEFFTFDEPEVIIISEQSFPNAQFLLGNYVFNKTEPLFSKNISKGENKFSLPPFSNEGNYELKVQLDDNKIISKRFSVKKPFIKYKNQVYPFQFQFYYPNWQILDKETIKRVYLNLFPIRENKFSEGMNIVLMVQDSNQAQFAVIYRKIDSKNTQSFDFQKYLEDLEKEEKEALLKAGFIEDYKINKKEIKEKETVYEIKTLDKGVEYLIKNKTLLIENFLKQKYLISFNFSVPNQYANYYEVFIDYIFNNLEPLEQKDTGNGKNL